MDEKKDDEHRISDGSKKLTNEYLQQASYLGAILPLLDIAYETILEKRIKKYDLNIVKEFWIYFGLLIFTSIYYYYGIKIEAVIFFLFATLFTLIVYNFDFFKSRLLPDETNEMQRFIAEIDKKTFQEVIDFIKEYRNKLKENDIRLIIKSNHGKNWTVYKFLLSYQKLSSNILVDIIETNKIEIIGEDLFKKFIERLKMGISFENYKILVIHFKDNKNIVKTINIFNPSYLRTRSRFKTFAIFIQSFYISIIQGKISEAIKFIIIALMIAISIFGFNQITGPYLRMEPYQSFPILLLINYFFAIAITATFIWIFVTFCLTTITKILWYIIGIFAPDQPDYVIVRDVD
jgi:hypothetical protein